MRVRHARNSPRSATRTLARTVWRLLAAARITPGCTAAMISRSMTSYSVAVAAAPAFSPRRPARGRRKTAPARIACAKILAQRGGPPQNRAVGCRCSCAPAANLPLARLAAAAARRRVRRCARFARRLPSPLRSRSSAIRCPCRPSALPRAARSQPPFHRAGFRDRRGLGAAAAGHAARRRGVTRRAAENSRADPRARTINPARRTSTPAIGGACPRAAQIQLHKQILSRRTRK